MGEGLSGKRWWMIGIGRAIDLLGRAVVQVHNRSPFH